MISSRNRGIGGCSERSGHRREKDMARLIGLVLFVSLAVVSGNFFDVLADDATICYFHGVEYGAARRKNV